MVPSYGFGQLEALACCQALVVVMFGLKLWSDAKLWLGKCGASAGHQASVGIMGSCGFDMMALLGLLFLFRVAL